MNEGNNSPRAPLRAGLLNYVVSLAVLRESVRQLRDLVRLQGTEYDLVTSRSINIETALNSWRLSIDVVSAAMNRLEEAHGAVEVQNAQALDAMRCVEAQDNGSGDAAP